MFCVDIIRMNFYREKLEKERESERVRESGGDLREREIESLLKGKSLAPGGIIIRRVKGAEGVVGWGRGGTTYIGRKASSFFLLNINRVTRCYLSKYFCSQSTYFKTQ